MLAKPTLAVVSGAPSAGPTGPLFAESLVLIRAATGKPYGATLQAKFAATI